MRASRLLEVFFTALWLGLTSFGGPVAHIGYFERAYVRQRQWLPAQEFAALAALCQALPGPASSQLGFLIGLRRGGWGGACAAWLGFTLPSALLLYGCAVLSAQAQAQAQAQGPQVQAVLHGLKLAAAAVVAQAVWSMAQKLCVDRATRSLALLAAALMLALPGAAAQFAVLLLGAAGGLWLCRRPGQAPASWALPLSAAAGWMALILFALLLAGLPLLALRDPHGPEALAALFYRAGALVFGGGHVVLPLLHEALVPAGWITDERFLAGYGLAQAVPGPLFTLAAYLGAVVWTPSPVAGAALALVFIFLPGLLLVVAGAALWGRWAAHEKFRAALAGVNAAVVGILAAALIDPVGTGAVHGAADAALALIGFALLQRWKAPPLAVLALLVGAALLLN